MKIGMNHKFNEEIEVTFEVRTSLSVPGVWFADVQLWFSGNLVELTVTSMSNTAVGLSRVSPFCAVLDAVAWVLTKRIEITMWQAKTARKLLKRYANVDQDNALHLV